MINWGDPDGDDVWRPENLDAAAFFGADAEASLELGDLDVTASYALTLSYNLANGQELSDDVRVANIPVHTIKLEPEYALGDVKLSVRGSWRSERYINATTTLQPVFLLGARARYEVLDSVSVYLDADNLLNADYVETSGYPMPGMTLKTGVRITLD
jgi:outer membrane receptor protein involved in Fe transport